MLCFPNISHYNITFDDRNDYVWCCVACLNNHCVEDKKRGWGGGLFCAFRLICSNTNFIPTRSLQNANTDLVCGFDNATYYLG